MQQFTSTQAKQNFGELLKAAAQGPVAIERHNKVQAIVASPADFASSSAARQDLVKSERRLARLNQALVERDRLIRHQKIAIDLLTLPPARRTRLIQQAQAMVARWRVEQLCSPDYIERWSAILQMPARQIAETIVSDAEGWGPALRQNSPWVGEHAS